MDTSRYIARLMGPVMLVIGIGMAAGMFVEGESYSSLMKEFIGSRALIFITACLRCLRVSSSSMPIIFGCPIGGCSSRRSAGSPFFAA